ncbi:SusC/RagA family TonB-linked outer membrane protein [Flagellimonas myxillae]|uniref:SusC/RagA family TonB-linked outer membrane protein n=1 Tax=Flagellimonas myxillae TaxID=2942214 RepID=UPI00201EB724|nr:TonB-dependent receptor [Muricauda myxillae]MCL6266923.1 TonB-dependent receptor [Muricauda myxillae]
MKNKIRFCLLLVALYGGITWAQTTITGNVKSANDNAPLPGVSIILEGASIGTTSDFDGNFSLDLPSNEGTLLFSYIGFLDQHVVINNQTVLEITMEEDIAKLDEVVVVGYGTQKKSDIVGAVTSVKVDELQEVPIARADQALQGRVAGLQISNNDASANGSVTIRIRGISSINGGSNPLVIIDGVQGATLGDVHPNDIKSIEVLKDASATAIYGSRGASGVILITTKKGRNQKPTITVNSYTTVHQLLKKFDFLNAHEYATQVNTNRQSRGLPTVFSDAQLQSFATNGGTDWQGEIYRSGFSHNQHVNVSGGTDNMNYSVSGDYLENNGIVINSSFRRYSMRSNISANLSKKVKVGLNAFLNFSKDNPTVLNTRDSQGSPVYAALLFAPTRAIFEADGSYSQPGGGHGPVTEYNPVALANEPIRDNYSNSMILNPTFEYEFLKGLKANINVSYQLFDRENGFYINERITNGNESDRQASIYNGKWSNFQSTNILTYENEFNGKHNLKLTGVYEQQTQKFNENWAGARGFLTNAVTYNNLGLGETPSKPSSFRNESSLESYMGRLNYAFDEKYSITLTGRSDAASVFSKNNKRAFFASAGLAWTISNENFLKGSETINNLKLRGSYGEVGNAAIRPYQSLSRLDTGSDFSFSGTNLNTGITLSTQADNPDLKWETTESYNVGLDLAMFNYRLNLTADYYNKTTSDLLLERALFQASGFQTQLVNAGKVENKGIEIALSVVPVQSENFKWNSDFTFARNENMVLALNSGETELRLGGAGLPGHSDAVWLEVGQPIGLIRGLEFDGIWGTDEAILAEVYGVTPGSEKYVDQNNDGVYSIADATNIGNALPDFTYSWNNTFTYKNLSLNIFAIGVQGNDIYNIGRSLIEGGDGLSVVNKDVWTPDNQDSNIPAHNAEGGFRNSSRWIEDGSYFRIKNITLGYNFPRDFIGKLGMGSCRVYATGTNLFTITDYSGYDPESNNSEGSDTFAGIDLASYPSQKQYTLGIDIKF